MYDSPTSSQRAVDPCSNIVESVRRGVSKSETARRFGVNRSTVKRYLKQFHEEGSLAPKKDEALKQALSVFQLPL